jgi:hypothetical protein
MTVVNPIDTAAASTWHIREMLGRECDGEELEHRTALLKARDYAALLRARTQCREATDYAADAHEIAGEALYADLPAERLAVVVQICRNLVNAARGFDLLEMSGRAQ